MQYSSYKLDCIWQFANFRIVLMSLNFCRFLHFCETQSRFYDRFAGRWKLSTTLFMNRVVEWELSFTEDLP
ncbi:hypothetical protein A6J42_16765 [Leptospira interrogans serovar Copenhageni]|nr:hypothetical protein A6J42_16765 [Leptospira interrogans serovar Copenhageni]ASP41731.1 hypothetical protein AMR47_07285 [Leptospira interrogans]KAA5549953.1 hypothetical protein F3G11_15130 [Leptospira interrogans serovar Copenhageni]QOI46106.1 hypothetical protein Lepto898_04815 [Leptospira interrogans serovar Icterohaemorrhagiae]WPM71920.1 hypothetical protein FYB70_04820 [Leptospira interrogans serovar Icterohaemorrhagiae]